MPGKNLIAAICAGVLVSMLNLSVAGALTIAERLESSIVVPPRGMTMESVEDRFGSPASRKLPVGEPPITRWIYAAFTVYFEDEYVILSIPVRN